MGANTGATCLQTKEHQGLPATTVERGKEKLSSRAFKGLHLAPSTP